MALVSGFYDDISVDLKGQFNYSEDIHAVLFFWRAQLYLTNCSGVETYKDILFFNVFSDDPLTRESFIFRISMKYTGYCSYLFSYAKTDNILKCCLFIFRVNESPTTL